MNTNLNLSNLTKQTSNSFTTSVRSTAPRFLAGALMALGLIFFSNTAQAQEEESAFDILVRSWEERNRSEDISAEKWSDAFRDVERVYDPSTGQVYQVENGFYDTYDINRNDYQMNDLEQLPADDHDLWMSAPRDEDEVE